MDSIATIVIESRFHGPNNSANGGYTCGRLARYIDGPARVRLRVPPPLDVPFAVVRTDLGVSMVHDGQAIGEAWPEAPGIEVPSPPDLAAAEAASRAYAPHKSHRYASCFVCGPDQTPGGLRIFPGPVAGAPIVACPWIPDPSLASGSEKVNPAFVWAALDCPGGFTFPEPEPNGILLGELTVELLKPVLSGRPYIVIGWEISHEGRKHRTGTAVFSAKGECHGIGRGVWFEVP